LQNELSLGWPAECWAEFGQRFAAFCREFSPGVTLFKSSDNSLTPEVRKKLSYTPLKKTIFFEIFR
jgi:hypothetical protein